MDTIKIGCTIAQLRQAKGLTQQQLAATLNVSHQAVSKWETGQALPDVLTLQALAKLFGLTLDQLLLGDIPKDRLEKESKPADPFADIGKGVQDIFRTLGNIGDSIFNPKKSSPEASPEDSDEDSDESEAPVEDSASDDIPEGAYTMDDEMPVSTPDDENAASEEQPVEDTIDFEKIRRLAPMMDRESLEHLLEMDCAPTLTADQLIRIAPYISRECVCRLAAKNNINSLSWEDLTRLAPYLGKDIVGQIGMAIAKGEELVKPVVKNIADAVDNATQNSEVLQNIGKTVDSTVRKVTAFGKGVLDDIASTLNSAKSAYSTPSASAEASESIRTKVIRSALANQKWNWLADHLDDIDDDNLLHEIAQTACAAGMTDWVRENLPDELEDSVSVQDAIDAQDWDLLSEILPDADSETQKAIIFAFANAGLWDRVEDCLDDADIEEYGDELAILAYRAGETDFALHLSENYIEEAQVESLAQVALAECDAEFLASLSEELSTDFLDTACLTLADGGHWDSVIVLAAYATESAKSQILEKALAIGDWDIIDQLYDLMDE